MFTLYGNKGQMCGHMHVKGINKQSYVLWYTTTNNNSLFHSGRVVIMSDFVLHLTSYLSSLCIVADYLQ